MWSFKQKLNAMVVVSCKPQGVGMACIQTTGTKIPYYMQSFAYFPCNDMELEQEIIFNPTRVAKYIQTFMHTVSMPDTEVRISLEGPAVFESIGHKEPYEDDHARTLLDTMVWDYVLLGNKETHESSHYTCGITRELLFQYKLLALRCHLNVTCITTCFMALLSVIGTVSLVPKDVSDCAQLAAAMPLSNICLNLPKNENKVLIAELVGLCMARLSYD
jgi:hypothetical protein